MILLQNTEITDLRIVADIILELSIELSKKTNDQLLEPISEWVDDPDFMKRHSVILEDGIDWKAYKQKQRLWTRQQKLIAAERVKSYWREIQSRKNIRTEMGRSLGDKKFPDKKRQIPTPVLNADFLSPILQPFSPVEQSKRETEGQFYLAENLSPSDILPWRIILRQQINNKMNLDELPFESVSVDAPMLLFGARNSNISE